MSDRDFARPDENTDGGEAPASPRYMLGVTSPRRRDLGGDAWDVAWAAVCLASDKGRYVIGIELVVDGGITLKYV